MAKRRILVTGGAGYIGAHVVHALHECGCDVLVADNLSTGDPAQLPPTVDLETIDIADRPSMVRLLAAYRPECVFHFAGSIVVPESVTHPLAYYQNNTVASHALISACLETETRKFIFSSTAAVYGHPDTLPVDEQGALAPINPYGASKLMTETMLRDTAAAHRFHFAILRYFNVAGADPAGRCGQRNPKATHLIKIACEAALGLRDGVTIFGDDYGTPDGTCIRDFIHVSDLAAAHVLVMEELLRSDGNLLFNCGYGHGYSVRQVLDAVATASGKNLNIKVGPRRPGDVESVVADPRKIARQLNWTPAHDDIGVIVETALQWERSLQDRNRQRL